LREFGERRVCLAGRDVRLRALRLAAGLAGLTLLFVLYLRQSRTVAVGSDGGSIALQAWDMLHGNVLLHGWSMSDVPYYTTGLPEYMLLERLRGLGPDVVHVGGALTYTIVLALAALAAKGRASGREGAVRALIAAGIMLAPAAGSATYTVLLTPDHLISAVPVLLAWLVIERCRPRWYVPAAVALLLAWGLVGDSLTEVIGVAPMVAVCGFRVVQRWRAPALAAVPAPPPGRVPRPRWFEPSLVAASLAAIAIAALVSALIRADGGFTLESVAAVLEGGARLRHDAFLTGQGLLLLFGASFGRGQPVNMVFSALHLVGVALAASAVVIALRPVPPRFRDGDELMAPALALAVIMNVALYVPGAYVQDLLSTREIAAVLPLGAVLAGRVLADRILADTVLAGTVLRSGIGQVPVLAIALTVVLCGYGIALVDYSSQHPVRAQNQELASWLAAHHLDAGLVPSYWLANIVTLDSGGKVAVRDVAVEDEVLARPSGWGYADRWYNPAAATADFVVTDAAAGSPAWRSTIGDARRTFGPPASIRRYRQYTIIIWHRNVLSTLGTLGHSIRRHLA
jgi:hypothetical protein